MKAILLFCVFLTTGIAAFCQQAATPFADEIKAFTQQDSLQPPPPNPILFVGSSSIRLWPTLQEDFPGKIVLNRGFGGASIPDVARYAEETIFRYQPSRIVFYCGENDLAASDTVSAALVVDRFTQLFNQIRQRLPEVPFVFVSIKPSPSRAHIMPRVAETNRQIRSFLAKQPQTSFVDVYRPMLNKSGRPRPELFVSDSLHMSPDGYRIWKERLKPHIK